MARLNGNRGWKNIFTVIYGFINRSTSVKNLINASAGILRSPFSFIQTEEYYPTTGEYTQSDIGYYWSSMMETTEVRRLYYARIMFHAGSGATAPKGYGYSVRCVAKSPLLFMNKARRKTPTFF